MNPGAAVLMGIAILAAGWLLWTGEKHRVAPPDRSAGAVRGIAAPPAPREQDRVRAIRRRGDILSLERILQCARAGRDGRVLESELEREGARYLYEIELLDERGRVWSMTLDAKTGELVRETQGD